MRLCGEKHITAKAQWTLRIKYTKMKPLLNFTELHTSSHNGCSFKKMITIVSFLILCAWQVQAQVTVSGSNGADGNYTSLTNVSGAFQAINGTAQTGKTIIITLTANSTSEAGTYALNAGIWTSLTIYPTTPVTISGTVEGPLIDLNGADNVTIDGRVNATGSTKDLTITNTSNAATTGTSTIRFYNQATGNTVKYCTLKGSSTDAAAGVLFFSTTMGTTGNNDNTIDHNNITCAANANRPVNVIYSVGTATYTNNSNTISSNYIYDFFSKGTASYGINLGANTSGWNITDNSFYETASFASTASVAYNVIYLNNTSGTGFTVSNNYIGGQSASCGGVAWTKTNSDNIFNAIYINVGTSTASSIQGNVIANFSWSNSANAKWTGININAGVLNVGTDTGNTLGSGTSTGSITYTAATTNANIYAVYINSPNTVNVYNSTIGSITGGNASTLATNFYGIYKTAVAGKTVIYNNLIGSNTIAKSINLTSTSTSNAQFLYGIYSAGTDTLTITKNTFKNIFNLNNLATNSIGVVGIYCSGTSQGNIIANVINIISACQYTTLSNVGIYKNNGNVTIANNLLLLSCQYIPQYQNSLTGIYENGSTAADSSRIYFNTITVYTLIYSDNSLANSACLFSNSNLNVRDIRNNIFNTYYSSAYVPTSKYAAIIFNYTTPGNITLNYNDYWKISNYCKIAYVGATAIDALPLFSGQDAGSKIVDPNLTNMNLTTPSDFVPIKPEGLFGVSGTGITTDFYDNVRNYNTMGAFEVNPVVQVWINNIFQNGYFTLKTAFDAINAGTHKGALEIKISGNTSETATAMLNASGTGSASYSSIKIYPTTANLSINGPVAGPLINLNGADNVTIDGRVNRSGTRDLTIVNSNATASAVSVLFTGSAASDSLKYCNVQGSGISATLGIITFSTSVAGNTGNVVDNNSISCAGTSRPYNALYAAGTAGSLSNNTISNNLFSNFLNAGVASYGINLGALCTGWNITGNSFYETAAFTPSANVEYRLINITAGDSYTLSGNTLGGNGAGGVWTKSGTTNNNNFYGIYLAATTTAATSVQNNTIGGFAWPNGAGISWYGINSLGSAAIGTVTGNVIGGTLNTAVSSSTGLVTFYGINMAGGTASNNTIGGAGGLNLTSSAGAGIFYGINNTGTAATITSNTIGATTGTGVITVTNSTTGGNCYGINSAGGTISTNNIGAITAATSAAGLANNLYGIYTSGTTACTINNNVIGSTSTANSLNASSVSSTAANAQSVYGIYNSSTGTIGMSGNTIANLKNSTTNATTTTAGVINGIASTAGTNTISGNSIYNLSIANANNTATNTASVGGIVFSGVGAVNTATNNTIYSLSNTYATFAGQVAGIYFTGSTGANVCNRNFIRNLSVTGSSGASVYGILKASGAVTLSNNIISLGTGTTNGFTLYGIYETGAASNNSSVYFNTVYLAGDPTSGALASYGFYNAVTTNTRNIRNNLLVNVRSNNGATGAHYCIWSAGTSGLTCDYNDYYETGGSVGFLTSARADLAAWKTATVQDVNSRSADPLFVTAGGTSAANYIPSYYKLPGIAGTGITIDYTAATRTYNSMGAYDVLTIYPVDIYKNNVLQNSYNTLKGAFDAINAGTYKNAGGLLEIRVNDNTVETASAVLNASVTGGAPEYGSIKIYPTTTGLSISGTLSSPLIDLSGADKVTIDGRVNATGSTIDLTIVNTSTNAAAATIRFINDATYNRVQYCTLKGAGLGFTSPGTLSFSTGSSLGNSYNTISNNNITGVSSNNRPYYSVRSVGSAAAGNSNDTIKNNQFYNFLYYSNGAINSYGVSGSNYSTDWVVSENSFYETATSYSGTYLYGSMIYFNGTNCKNFTIINNYFGGSAAQANGLWKNSSDLFIYLLTIQLSLSTNSTDIIQGNVIRNFDLKGNLSGNFIDYANSLTSGGNISGNTIGSVSQTGSIKLTQTVDRTAVTQVYGIYAYPTSSSSFSVNNNTIAGITLSNTGNPTSCQLMCISTDCRSSYIDVSYNTIGSPTVTNSISSTSTVANGAPSLWGLYPNMNSNVHDNRVCNLSITSSNAPGTVYGIQGYTSLSNSVTISNNFIQKLSANSGFIYGINLRLQFNTGIGMLSNNIINLTNSSSDATIYGMNIENASTNSLKCYFNTVNLSGSSTTGAQNSYALYFNSGSNFLIYNNLFVNTRSNNGATGKHYAVGNSAGSNSDYNDYVYNTTSGSGGFLGTNGTDFSSLAAWQAATGEGVWSINSDPLFVNAGGSSATDYVPTYNKLYGVAGTGITTDYAGVTRNVSVPTMGAYEIPLDLPVEVWKNSTLQAGYVNVKGAFDAINAGTHQGALEIKIHDNTSEKASAVLNASGSGSASYTSVNIYPTISGLSVSGTRAAPLIDLNGADNVTIDGRVNATGSTPDLTITNNSASSTPGTSTIRFIADASNNTVRYCNLKGSTLDASAGILFFSTGTATGNDNNTIDQNNITCAADANRPYNVVYSLGSAGFINNGNTVSNNNIYNFFNKNSNSNGIYLFSNTSVWNITGNNFYETTTFTPSSSATYYVIQVSNASGINFNISNNYIGGSAAGCSGSPWTHSSTFNNNFYAIFLNPGSGTASNVQGNTIQNINWSQAAGTQWVGIYGANGDLNIGTTTGNTVGSNSIGSITYNATTAGASIYGINLSSSTILDCRNNTVGGITMGSGTSNSQSVYGIYLSGSGTNNISKNTMSNLINNTTNASGVNCGIYYSGGTTAGTISGNFINSISAGSGSTLYGINKVAGNVTLSNNIISLGNANSNLLYGIYETGLASNTSNLYFNTVYLGGSPASGSLASYGLYSAVTTNTRNFRNNLFVNKRSNSGAASGTHYAAYFVSNSATNLTLNYNDYYVSGTGTQLGYAGAAKSSLPLISGMDANSKTNDPLFVSAGGATASNYAPMLSSSSLTGLAGTGSITVDYFGTTRSLPTIGAIEQILPTLTTQAVSSITATTATGNGNITSLGVPNPTSYGVCWSSTNATPAITDSKVDNGAASATGTFTAAISGLTSGTLYYVRAYATNAAGTAYGNVVSFTSYIAPTVTTQAVSNINTTTATGNGNITSLGVPNPTSYGVCWSSSNATPSITDSKVDNGAVSATGAFTAAITGLTSGTLYYVRAYATNSAGTSYGGVVTFTSYIVPTVSTQAVSNLSSTTATGNGNITSLGVPNPTAYGVCWSSSNATPTISDSKVDKGAASVTGGFTASITGLSPGTLYYVRAYATNSAGTSYGGVVTFTSYIVPTVTTQAVGNIFTTTATGNGTIISLGLPNPTAYGVCWSSTNATPTISDSKVDNGAASATGSFSAAITGLTTSRIFYVRAYATNAAGTAYGNVVSFDYTNYWYGTTNTDWNTPSNWGLNMLPAPGEDIYFAASPSNHLVQDQNRTIGSLSNAQSTYRLVTNGYKLTLNGDFNQSNGAQVDASASGSSLTFSGTLAQSIPSGTFYNNQVVNLTVNNTNNVTLHGSLNLSGTLTATAGALDAANQSPTVTLNGSSAQTIESNTWLNNRIYKLIINNTAGVTNNAGFSINNDFTINTGSLFTIAPAKTLTVNGTISNNAGNSGFVITSTAAGTGSLIHSTDNIAATVNRYVEGSADAFHFLSSPVSGQTIAGSNWTPSGTHGQDLTGYDLYVWDEPASCWIFNLNSTVAPTWASVHSSSNFVPGRGYLYALQSVPATRQFSGNLNNGTINCSLSGSSSGILQGFNYVGNPYPSSIDWKNNAGYNRSMLTTSAGGYDVWIWSNTAGNYGVYNSASAGDAGTNGVSRYIAPMQGFFVKAASAGTFSFYNAARINNGNGDWVKVHSEIKQDEHVGITVKSQDSSGQDEIRVYFGYPQNQGGTIKLFNNNSQNSSAVAPGLYLPDGKQNYSVRYLNDTKTNNKIAMNFVAGKDGFYTLKPDLPDTIAYIYVEDKQTGVVKKMSRDESYTFKAQRSDASNRFNIRFEITGSDCSLPVEVHRLGDNLIIDANLVKEACQLRIFDTMGRIIFNNYYDSGRSITIPAEIRQLYIITICTAAKQSTFRVIQ